MRFRKRELFDDSEDLVEMSKYSTELSRAVKFLGNAKRAFRAGSGRKATKLAREAREMADRAKRLHRDTLRSIAAIERTVYEMKGIGYDTKDAEDSLDQAKLAILDTEYKKAMERLEETKYALKRSQFDLFPLLQTDVCIKTLIGYEEGRIIYKIRVENNMNTDLGDIVIQPMVPEEYFGKLKEQMVGVIGPHQYKEVTYKLVPRIENWNIGVAGRLIQGKDVSIKTMLKCSLGKAVYKVRVENNKGNPIENLMIVPFVPEALEPDEDTKIIDLLLPYDSVTVVFPLQPRGFDKVRESEDDAPKGDRVFEMDENGEEEEEDWEAASWEEEDEEEKVEEPEWEEEEEVEEPEWEEEEEEVPEWEEELVASGFRPVKEDTGYMAYDPDAFAPRPKGSGARKGKK